MNAATRLLLLLRRELEAVEVQAPWPIGSVGVRQEELLLGGAVIVEVDIYRLHHFKIPAVTTELKL